MCMQARDGSFLRHPVRALNCKCIKKIAFSNHVVTITRRKRSWPSHQAHSNTQIFHCIDLGKDQAHLLILFTGFCDKQYPLSHRGQYQGIFSYIETLRGWHKEKKPTKTNTPLPFKHLNASFILYFQPSCGCFFFSKRGLEIVGQSHEVLMPIYLTPHYFMACIYWFGPNSSLYSSFFFFMDKREINVVVRYSAIQLG